MTKRKWKCACGRCYGNTNAVLPKNALDGVIGLAVHRDYPQPPFDWGWADNVTPNVQGKVWGPLQPVRGGMDAVAEVMRESPRPAAFAGLIISIPANTWTQATALPQAWTQLPPSVFGPQQVTTAPRSWWQNPNPFTW